MWEAEKFEELEIWLLADLFYKEEILNLFCKILGNRVVVERREEKQILSEIKDYSN